MPIRKKGNIKVKTSPNGYGIERTGYTFYSYDKNSAALYFEFNDQNGQPTNLKKATVRIMMILNDDDRKNASPIITKAEIISELRGTAKYDIPESLLSYEGKVNGYICLEFEDGSHTDEGRFIFNIKRSMISDVLPEAGDKYVQDFEDVKERVEQAGDSATKDIEKAKDDAESQIGDYVGEVESAKQDISSSASDVQSKASKANEDISNLVNGIKVYGRNLVLGTSSQVVQASDWNMQVADIKYDKSLGDDLCASVMINNAAHADVLVKGNAYIILNAYDSSGNILATAGGNPIDYNADGLSQCSISINDGTADIKAYIRTNNMNENAFYSCLKVEKGVTAKPWTPAPKDIVTKSDIEQIDEAVDDLATKQYVDESNETITTQLAQTEKLLGLKTYVKYGGVDLTKFEELNHDLNFDLWRDPTDGKIKHDWTLKKEGYTTFYISQNGRTDTNDGKSIEEPWPNLRYTLETIENDPSINKAIIKFIDRPHRGMNFYLTSYTPLTKKYIIESDFPLGAVQEIDGFTNYVDNVFKAETTYASHVEEVLRVDAKDCKGNFKKYERVSSLSECVSKKDTYFTDSSAVYVHGEGTNVENTVFLVQDPGMKFPVKDGGEVILNNINYLAVDNNLSFAGNSNTTGKVILNNVNVNCFNGDSDQNGIETNGIKSIWLFNCRVFGSRRDGFNYHNTKQLDGRGFVFEYDCYAENTGNNDDNTNNNISTAHEGIHVLRVGTKGNKSGGPLIADIQGCYSLNIDVFVNDTRRGNHLQNPDNAGFYFNDNVSEYVSNPNGKAWLINCGSGSPTEWGINGSDSFKQTNKIFIDNYMGINLPQDLELTLL